MTSADLRQLTPKQRTCIELRAAHMSAKEIGRELGISPHTVAMHLRLAREKLRAERSAFQLLANDRDQLQPVHGIAPFEGAGMVVLAVGALLTLLGLAVLLTILFFVNVWLASTA